MNQEIKAKIIKDITRHFRITLNELVHPGRCEERLHLPRKITLYCLYNYAFCSQKEAANIINRGSNVSTYYACMQVERAIKKPRTKKDMAINAFLEKYGYKQKEVFVWRKTA